MATFTITIPDAALTRVINGICTAGGYRDMVGPPGQETPNPETKVQFAKRAIRGVILNALSQAEAELAAADARKTVQQDIDAIGITVG